MALCPCSILILCYKRHCRSLRRLQVRRLWVMVRLALLFRLDCFNHDFLYSFSLVAAFESERFHVRGSWEIMIGRAIMPRGGGYLTGKICESRLSSQPQCSSIPTLSFNTLASPAQSFDVKECLVNLSTACFSPFDVQERLFRSLAYRFNAWYGRSICSQDGRFSPQIIPLCVLYSRRICTKVF